MTEGCVSGRRIIQRLVNLADLTCCEIFSLDHSPLLHLHPVQRRLSIFEDERLGNDDLSGNLQKSIQKPRVSLRPILLD